MVAGAVAAGAAAAFAIRGRGAAGVEAASRRRSHRLRSSAITVARWLTAAMLLGIVVVAALVRLWHFNDVGYNSDEAVYSGQGAGIAHDPQLAPYFPVFRAHPLLFQSVIAIGYELHQGDWFARAAAIGFGGLCVLATFELGRLLYGVRAGLLAAAVLALMPYHVIVSRQVLLDGPQAFLTTVTLCAADPLRPFRANALALLRRGRPWDSRYSRRNRASSSSGRWTPFFALSPEIRVRPRAISDVRLPSWPLTIAAVPARAVAVTGQAGTGGNFLAWQLVRQAESQLRVLLHTRCRASSGSWLSARLAALSLLARAYGLRWTWRETLVAY